MSRLYPRDCAIGITFSVFLVNRVQHLPPAHDRYILTLSDCVKLGLGRKTDALGANWQLFYISTVVDHTKFASKYR